MTCQSAIRSVIRSAIRSPIGAEGIIAGALVDINGDNLTTSAGLVTAMPNQGLGGSGYSLTQIVGTGANLRAHPTGSCLLFGASGDYASTASASANQITGDCQWVFDGAADDWSGGTTITLIAKRTAAAGLMYQVTFSTNAKLYLAIRTGSTNYFDDTNSDAISLTNGQRVKFRVSRVASTGVVTFEYSTDGGDTWNDAGTDNGTAGTLDSNAAPLEIGSNRVGTQDRFKGLLYGAQLYNGIDGTLAVDFNPTDCPNTGTTTFPSLSTGETWTLNGNATIQNSGHTGFNSIQSVVAETSAGQDIATFTRFIVGRFVKSAPSADEILFDARSNAGKSVSLFTDESNSDKWTLDAGGTPIALSEAYDNNFHVFTVRYTADSNSLLRVSGVGEVTGDCGSEVLDYGTLLGALGGGSTAKFIGLRDIVFSGAKSDAVLSILENSLKQEYRIPA